MGLNFCEMFMQLCLLRLFKNSFGWEFTNNGFGTFPTLFCVGYFFFLFFSWPCFFFHIYLSFWTKSIADYSGKCIWTPRLQMFKWVRAHQQNNMYHQICLYNFLFILIYGQEKWNVCLRHIFTFLNLCSSHFYMCRPIPYSSLVP